MNDLVRLARDWISPMAPNPYLQAVAALLAFALLATLASRIFRRLVGRAVGGWGESERRLLRTVGRLAFISVVLLGGMISMALVPASPRVKAIGLALVGTLLASVWIRFAWRAVGLVSAMLAGRNPQTALAQPSTAPLVRNALKALVVLVGAYAILEIWDVNVTALVASAGIVGLAFSFAAQDTLGNLLAGIAIVTDKPYRVGDYIVLDSGERGEVTGIGMRSTRLLTRDDVEVSIPNGIIGKAKIVNESGGPNTKYRVRVPIGVAYGSDLDAVIACLLNIALGHGDVCRSPEPRVRFRQFGPSSLDLELLCWIGQPAQRGAILHELNCEVYRAFSREGITIPFPQLEVTIKESPPGAQQRVVRSS
ncbi:MAG: mechanosensitive ion channel family protein [Gammaproteobacteria bacterium]